MPLFSGGISSNGYGIASESANSGQRGLSSAPAAIPDRKSRRVSLGQRLLPFIVVDPRLPSTPCTMQHRPPPPLHRPSARTFLRVGRLGFWVAHPSRFSQRE